MSVVPLQGRSKILPVAEWPAADQSAWRAAFKTGSPFEPPGIASQWSTATVRKNAAGYGRYLSWLEDNGELDPAAAPKIRVSRERLRRYLAELQERNRGHTIHSRIQELGDALRAIAPDGDWGWIKRAAGRLRLTTTPANDKRPRLRPAATLAATGFRLMAKAETDPGLSEIKRAALFRDGLVFAFLTFHPIRRHNVASIQIGREITSRGEAFTLQLSKHDTKNRRAHDAVVAPKLADAMKRYLERYRPVLLQARGRWHAPAGNAFWISHDGSPCTEETFRNIVEKHTAAPGRRPLSPHLFRSCAATSIAIDAPELVSIIPGLLGHSTEKTGERHYILASSLEASRSHASLIEALREELRDADTPSRQQSGSRRRAKPVRPTNPSDQGEP